VTSVREGVTVSITIGSNVLTRNNEQINLDVPAQIIGGRALVPARAVAEGFGLDAGWEQATQTVMIGQPGTVATAAAPAAAPGTPLGSGISFHGNRGNLPGNRRAVLHGERIFFANHSDSRSLYSMRLDGSDIRKHIDSVVDFLNSVGNRVYFTAGGGLEGPFPRGIQSVDANGGDRQMHITTGSDIDMVIVDGLIYANHWGDSGVIVYNLDGSRVRQINGPGTSSRLIDVMGDRILMRLNTSDWFWHIGRDGSGLVESRRNIFHILSVEPLLFMRDGSSGHVVYTTVYGGNIDISRENMESLNDLLGMDGISSISVVHNDIYYNGEYFPGGDRNNAITGIWRSCLDGSGRTLLLRSSSHADPNELFSVGLIQVVGDWIFFAGEQPERLLQQHMVRRDGSGFVRLERP